MNFVALLMMALVPVFLACCDCGTIALGGDAGLDGADNVPAEPVQETDNARDDNFIDDGMEEDLSDMDDGGEVIATCNGHPIGEGWVCIMAGDFTMGVPEGWWGDIDMTQHEVTLTVDFAMMDHELTQGEFQDLMGYNPSQFPACGADCPVDSVMWYEAIACANALSRREGLPECFHCDVFCDLKSDYSRPQDCPGYRLPTDAEWEYAARADTTTDFYNGDMVDEECGDPNLSAIGWYCGNSDVDFPGCVESHYDPLRCLGPHPVKQMIPNPWGLYDMSGNMGEWAWDWYGEFAGPATDPTGAGGGWARVVRNAGFFNGAKSCRSGDRNRMAPNAIYYLNGFRLVKSLLP